MYRWYFVSKKVRINIYINWVNDHWSNVSWKKCLLQKICIGTNKIINYTPLWNHGIYWNNLSTVIRHKVVTFPSQFLIFTLNSNNIIGIISVVLFSDRSAIFPNYFIVNYYYNINSLVIDMFTKIMMNRNIHLVSIFNYCWFNDKFVQ